MFFFRWCSGGLKWVGAGWKKKKNKKKRQRRGRERYWYRFFSPSIGGERLHKGCRAYLHVRKGCSTTCRKKKATGQINDLASVAIFGVTFLFSRLFFFFFPSRPLLSVDLFSFAKPKFERGSCGWSYTSFFFSHQEAETFLGKGFFRLIPSKLPVQ